MRNPNYPISPVEQSEQKEFQQEPDVPIIDIIRHGEREGSEFMPNTKARGFKLDSAHLELSEKGMDQIKETAKQLLEIMDKENEVVLLMSSPVGRTYSSALVLENELRQAGVEILNAKRDIKISGSLGDIGYFMDKVYDKYSDENLEPRTKTGRVDVKEESDKMLDLQFHQWLRHVNNIYNYLSDETLAKLKGKRLRIVAFAHGETGLDFKLGSPYRIGGQLRGQIFEITPQSKLPAEGNTFTDLKMYPKEDKLGREANLTRDFKPREKPPETSIIEKPKSKPAFSLDSWKYDEGMVLSLIPRLARGDRKMIGELEDAYLDGGGKAFGLKVCQLIVQNFTDSRYNLEVPEWEIVKDISKIADEDKWGAILRSSDLKEDWVDPRTGVLPSFNFRNFSDINKFEGLKKQKKLPTTPFVRQEAKEGYGLVVDIRYSQIAQKIIARIASGNNRGSHKRYDFTSATEDSEASVGIWDAKTGNPELATRHFKHYTLFEGNKKFQNGLIPKLFKAIEKTGINFEVQLEFVVHPEHPNSLYLVQIRPTPKNIYDSVAVEGVSSPEAKQKSELIAKSAVVNGAFDFTGEVNIFSRDDVIANHNLGNYLTYHKKTPPDLTKRSSRGNIGIYYYDPVDYLSYIKAAHTYLGAYWQGNDVQLTHTAIRPNTWHGDMAPRHEDVYNLLDQCCGMVSLDDAAIDKLRKLAGKAKTPLKLRVVSDGLLAEVYLLKRSK